LDRAQRKIKTAALSNVCLLQSGARYLLQALCATEALAEVNINFPDPWPKARQLHRRLINVDFLHLLATRMVRGGLLDIATDHADYALAITEALEATPYFRSRLSTTFVRKIMNGCAPNTNKSAWPKGAPAIITNGYGVKRPFPTNSLSLRSFLCLTLCCTPR
jgi:tRNA G46 methylase TrmB